MRISDWSSDLCSSDLRNPDAAPEPDMASVFREDAREKLAEVSNRLAQLDHHMSRHAISADAIRAFHTLRGSARVVDASAISELAAALELWLNRLTATDGRLDDAGISLIEAATETLGRWCEQVGRSEEHTSELQSLMRISSAVFCLKKKKKTK